MGEDSSKEVKLREQDKWLPIANVYRIMKNALPRNAKVSKEAKECVQECVSEFVSFITSEASEKCSAEKRKTVNGEDILFAMTTLGFENYAEVLKIYLTKYREYLATKERSKRNPVDRQNASTVVMDEIELSQDNDLDLKPEKYSYESFEENSPGEALYEKYSGQFTNVVMNQFDQDEA